MSLIVAVPCALAAAAAYGASTAVQHRAANDTTAAPGTAHAGGLVGLLRDPRWWLSIGGDSVGLVLQVIALATGPVVVIQPLLVLALPISLPVGHWLGGPMPGRRAAVGCAAVLASLAVFFVLVGDPGEGGELTVRTAIVTMAIAAAVTGVVLLGLRGRPARLRAIGIGALAGSLFGLVGVLINAAASAYSRDQFSGLVHPEGLVPLLGLLAVGGVAFTLTQVSFQIGELSASFPANESAAPLVAVVLGAVMLHEVVPAGLGHLAVYAVCVAGVIAGTVLMAGEELSAPVGASGDATHE